MATNNNQNGSLFASLYIHRHIFEPADFPINTFSVPGSSVIIPLRSTLERLQPGASLVNPSLPWGKGLNQT